MEVYIYILDYSILSELFFLYKQKNDYSFFFIKKGDSLLRILRNHYGDDSKLAEICDVNGIVDPNNIQVGQTILLP